MSERVQQPNRAHPGLTNYRAGNVVVHNVVVVLNLQNRLALETVKYCNKVGHIATHCGSTQSGVWLTD
jgi:hypothetical protein